MHEFKQHEVASLYTTLLVISDIVSLVIVNSKPSFTRCPRNAIATWRARDSESDSARELRSWSQGSHSYSHRVSETYVLSQCRVNSTRHYFAEIIYLPRKILRVLGLPAYGCDIINRLLNLGPDMSHALRNIFRHLRLIPPPHWRRFPRNRRYVKMSASFAIISAARSLTFRTPSTQLLIV